MSSSADELRSPSASDMSSPDDLTLSEISSLDSFELIDPDEDGAATTDSAATGATDGGAVVASPTEASSNSRRDALRDRHEGVLLALRPELPPTVFQFPDPSAPSEDDALSHGGTADDELEAKSSTLDATAQGDLSVSSAGAITDSTTTTNAVNRQPRWLVRTSAWLSTLSSGSGATERDYMLPKLSLGSSFSQSCAEALHVATRLTADVDAGTRSASMASSQGRMSLLSHLNSACGRSSKSSPDRWQSTSLLALIALTAAVISFGLQLRPSHAQEAQAQAVPVVSAYALGAPAPVSLQVWKVVDFSVRVQRQPPHYASVAIRADDAYLRVERVLEARRKRRVQATAVTSDIVVGSSTERSSQPGPSRVKDEVDLTEQTPTPPPTPSPEPASVENSSSTSSFDWDAVALFIRSLAAEARALANYTQSVAVDILRAAWPQLHRAYAQLCRAADRVRDVGEVVRKEMEPHLLRVYEQAVDHLQAVRDDIEPKIAKAYQRSVQVTSPYLRAAQDHGAEAARQVRVMADAVRETTDPIVDEIKQHSSAYAESAHRASVDAVNRARIQARKMREEVRSRMSEAKQAFMAHNDVKVARHRHRLRQRALHKHRRGQMARRAAARRHARVH